MLWGAAIGSGAALVYSTLVPANRTATVVSVLFWYGIPALTLVLCAWALRSATERRVGIALLLLTGVVCAFAAEALLRAFPEKVEGLPFTTVEADSICPGEYRRQAGCLAAAARGLPFDSRSTIEVVEDFEDRGIEAWPSIDGSHFVESENTLEVDGRGVVPVSAGVPEVLTVFCNEAGEWVTYEADEYGFNNPLGAHGARRIDVALLGDSFVQGWCVPFEQTLTGRIAALRSGEEGAVIGAGVEGSGPLFQLGMEVEYLAPLRPKLVVWVFFEGNDLRDLRREYENRILARYLEPGFKQDVRAINEELGLALRGYIDVLRVERAAEAERAAERREIMLRRHRSLAGWLRLTELRTRLADLTLSPMRERPFDAELFERVATRLRDDVAGWGGTLVFAYMPSHRRFRDSESANPHRAAILDLVETLAIPIVDLDGALSSHPDPLSLYPFRLESHLTAEGYDLVARVLHEEVESLETSSMVTE